MAETLGEIDDALVDTNRTGRERLRRPLLYLEEAEITQRTLGRERFPCRLRQDRHRQRQRRPGAKRIVVHACAEPADTRVELHRHAEKEQIALERMEIETTPEDYQGGR